MSPDRNWRHIASAVFSTRMLIALLMGFASGLPLLLTITLLQAWMKSAGVDLATIGLFALVGLPYTVKFLWAPFLDRFTPLALGRRRGWLLLTQLALMGAIVLMAFTSPQHSPLSVALAAMLVAFFSATQDIVIDAYRREALLDEELGLGAGLYVPGYRAAMLLVGGGGLVLADQIGFSGVYLVMAALMGTGVITTLLAPEPRVSVTPRTLREAVIDPFAEYFTRKHALLILLFIVLYKLGDQMASHMTIPFYLELGYSNTEIGTVVKTFGVIPTLVGGVLGGIFMLRIGIYAGLWVFGIAQALSTAGFVILLYTGHSLGWLAAVIAFENLSAGMGTAAFIAFMGSLTNRSFTATQYALLTSLMGVPRVFASAPTGFMAIAFGWEAFFLICALIAIPGLLLLVKFRTWLEDSAPAEPAVTDSGQASR